MDDVHEHLHIRLQDALTTGAAERDSATARMPRDDRRHRIVDLLAGLKAVWGPRISVEEEQHAVEDEARPIDDNARTEDRAERLRARHEVAVAIAHREVRGVRRAVPVALARGRARGIDLRAQLRDVLVGEEVAHPQRRQHRQRHRGDEEEHQRQLGAQAHRYSLRMRTWTTE